MSEDRGNSRLDSLQPIVLADEGTLPEAVYQSKSAPRRPNLQIKPNVITYSPSGMRSDAFEGLEFNLVEIAKEAL